jgi:tRNA U34 5-methylaminomethyl-2-thiouridine-forming methyltransferase MnmC
VKFRQRDVLQLANALARNAESLADFLKRLRLAAIQAKPLENNLLLAVIQYVKQTAELIAEILVAQQFKRRLRVLVADNFTELGGIVVTDWRIE